MGGEGGTRRPRRRGWGRREGRALLHSPMPAAPAASASYRAHSTCWEKKKKKNNNQRSTRFIIYPHGLNEITERRGALDYSLHVFPRVEERLFKRL